MSARTWHKLGIVCQFNDYRNRENTDGLFQISQGKKVVTSISVGLSIITVLFLAMAREPYAITVMFLLLLMKGGLLCKQAKAGQ